MDLTPDALRETTFRGALRGYNVDDVDEFVERVALGMAELLEQLRLASERAASAERRAKEVASSDDAMRRTLAHAQKLAEAVLAEAREEASRVTDEADQAATQQRAGVKAELAAEREAAQAAAAEAERLLAEARGGRAGLDAEADAARAAAWAELEAEQADARAQLAAKLVDAAEGIDAEVQTEVERLHGVRQALQLDVAVLTSWMHEQRDSVRNVLVETLAAIDRAAPIDDPPPVADVDTTNRLAGSPAEPDSADQPRPAAIVLPPPDPPSAPLQDAGAPEDAAAPDARLEDPSRHDLPPPVADLDDHALGSFPDLSDEEFLAELKKAAMGGDDSPFGPGDQGHRS